MYFTGFQNRQIHLTDERRVKESQQATKKGPCWEALFPGFVDVLLISVFSFLLQVSHFRPLMKKPSLRCKEKAFSRISNTL